MKQQARTKEILRESLWITIGWEWLQMLLGRAVDAVLWVTMIFACYQLIPDAPQPPVAVSVFMFIAQFVALDIGGLGLNQMALREGLPLWSYARIVAYILIGITLVTIAYSGILHAVHNLDPQITAWVEVVLVVARSVMTVLYGQAIHALKAEEHAEQNRTAELEQALSAKSAEFDTLTGQLNTKDTELNTLRVKVNTLTAQLDTLSQESQTLSVKLDGKEAQLVEMRNNRESSLKEHQESTELIVSALKAQLTDAYQTIETLRPQLLSEQKALHAEKQKVLALTAEFDTLTGQLNTKDTELNTLRVKVNTLTAQLDTKNTESSPVSGNTGTEKIVRLDQTQDSNYESRIRALLTSEPGLSGREIARRVGCSIPTACNWKRVAEKAESTKCADA